jgi:hypothetical protein
VSGTPLFSRNAINLPLSEEKIAQDVVGCGAGVEVKWEPKLVMESRIKLMMAAELVLLLD